jgi:S-adenosylmethionine:tRNA ribosyltransferase-isomerase
MHDHRKITATIKMTDVSDYDYHLPRELIAQQPLANRSDARLLVVDRRNQSFEHLHVRDLPELLHPLDCLVLNDTRVVPARLVGHRTGTGGRWQGLFLETDEHGVWKVMSKARGKLRAGETITLETPLAEDDVRLVLLTHLGEGVWAVRPERGEHVFDILDRVGRVPLPPYIRGGEMIPDDRETYQTVYAERDGAVAAPTAGLHFTSELLAEIKQRDIPIVRVTLHVGIGTFRPIATETVERHQMHSERCEMNEMSAKKLNEVRRRGGRIVAVGTTVVRVLETVARGDEFQAFHGETDLFIHPPHEFRGVDCLMTNFHLPRSTLLVLVRTFGGDELIQRAYAEAIREEYRFYSYGDAMFIL